MFRPLLCLAMLSVTMVTPAQGQPPAGVQQPSFFWPQIQRLPPVDPMPTPADGPVLASPEGSASLPELPPEPEAEQDAGPAEEVIVVEEEPEPEIKLWEGSFELGLDGTSGNTDTFNVRFGFDLQRETDCNNFTMDMDYNKKRSDSRETANRAFLDWRFEQDCGETRITSFVHGTGDYDEFKAFDFRVTLDSGFGYDVVKTDSTTFTTRAGAGVSREFDSPDEEVVPEAVFGLEFKRKLNDRQKISATIEYTPDVTAMADFRMKTRASWELLLDRQTNLSLKLSALDRYDSTPNGDRPNDVDYSAVLLWKF